MPIASSWTWGLVWVGEAGYVLADCLVACLHVRTDRQATSIGELGLRREAPVGADSKGGEGREREEEEEEEEVITSVMPR